MISGEQIPTRRLPKTSELIAREIVLDITGLPPGTMLPPENVMLEKYQVARGSIREALRILEVQGLVVIRSGPKGGPMVAPVDSAYLGRTTSLYLHRLGATYRDLIEARLILDPVMARMAASRRDPQSIERLEKFLHIPESLDDPEFVNSSIAFHSTLVGLSGNSVLDLVGGALLNLWYDLVERQIYPPDMRSKMQDDHHSIARAIADGDEDAAERMARAHMKDVVERLEQRQPGLLDQVIDWR